jgi:hypothetical protein
MVLRTKRKVFVVLEGFIVHMEDCDAGYDTVRPKGSQSV